jgi:hypothetical protein
MMQDRQISTLGTLQVQYCIVLNKSDYQSTHLCRVAGLLSGPRTPGPTECLMH